MFSVHHSGLYNGRYHCHDYERGGCLTHWSRAFTRHPLTQAASRVVEAMAARHGVSHSHSGLPSRSAGQNIMHGRRSTIDLLHPLLAHWRVLGYERRNAATSAASSGCLFLSPSSAPPAIHADPGDDRGWSSILLSLGDVLRFWIPDTAMDWRRLGEGSGGAQRRSGRQVIERESLSF